MTGLVVLIVIIVVSFVLAIFAFSGKDIILDDAYIKASEEERKSMNKQAYRLQAGIIFLFIVVMSLCNAIRLITQISLFGYLAGAMLLIGIVYAIVSHYQIKKK
ncbi:MAG: DUF3784 domain-containing protein [Clostridia bacterium]|nr:DUF3784 domain-containing protein [Clostridia bacterium]